MKEDIERKARERVYLFLAEKLGLQPSECHIGRFDLEMCDRAVRILAAVKYGDIRHHFEIRKQSARRLKGELASDDPPALSEDGLSHRV